MLGDSDETEGVLKVNSRILEAHELRKLDKSEKSLVTAIYSTGKDIRIQLNEQLRCLDSRLESQQGQLAEIQDIFRRRAEIELNYSRDLDRLAKLLTSRQKEQKTKRESWAAQSSQDIWRQLVAETKRAGRDHAALAEIYSTAITARCTQLNDDITRIYKKCRETGFEIHEEVLKVLHELHTAMKTHHAYQSEFRQAESKLQVVEKQRTKLRDTIAKEKLEKSRKYRLIEKEAAKRTAKYTEARLKATKARNEYLLCMDAANSSIHKYFMDDLSDLIDCMDFGFHQSLSRAMMMRSSAMEQLRRSLQQDVDAMNKVLGSLDSRRDKKHFLERNDQAFMIPKKFEYQPVRRDETELVQKPVLEDLESRKVKLAERLASLRAESEEIWKSLEAAEKTLLEMVNCADYDTTRYFVEEEATRKERESDSLSNKQRIDRQETEQFYLAKFREYILNSNRISRLQAKYDHIRKCLGEHSCSSTTATLPRPITNSRRRIGRTMLAGQPKLFGGSLEEYLELTQQDIPLVVKSCIRVINLYGLHHQGIFRVSGSQVEINNFRESFERGEDPLADMTDASDINSVCGVLKLYLRELREPVFSVQYFDQFMDLAKLESKHEFVLKVRDLVKSWPRSIFVVMRYIFAFLNHLSEYSDENMMDPYNLAICFGPTLVPIPTDRDQVQFQNLVNELIKNFIIFHEDIFPNDGLGITYEKYISSEPEDVQEYGNEDITANEEDFESEVTEDESEVLEAQAQYDFTARSSREVSFRKGDTILLFSQVSGDWWRGSVGGREGLIPDKYILLKIRGEDDTRESLPSISEDSRRRASSQSDTLRSSRSDQSPRLQRSHNSVSCPPSTPPLSRTAPHRHSISHAPPAATIRATTVIAVSQPVAVSRDSVSLDSGNPSPDTTFTTNSERASRSPPGPAGAGSESDSRSLDFDSLSIDESLELLSAASDPYNNSSSVSAVATVIHVPAATPPLDQSVQSAEISRGPTTSPTASPSAEVEHLLPGPALMHEGHSRGSADRPVRSGAPLQFRLNRLSPNRARLRTAGSQDSLASTGSNQDLMQELQRERETVVELVEDVMRHSSPEAAETVYELAGRPPGSREAVGRKLSMDEVHIRRSNSSSSEAMPLTQGGVGARPRSIQQTPVATPRTNRPPAGGRSASDKDSEVGSVLLKQTSWASRRTVGSGSNNTTVTADEVQTVPPASSATGFTRNRDLWERRANTSTPSSDEEKERGAGGFRGSRNFWEQRTGGSNSRQQNQQQYNNSGQTPDLVMDLPAGALASSPPVPIPRPRRSRSPSADSVCSSGESSSTSGDNSSLSPSLSSADTFAAADTDTLKKSGGGVISGSYHGLQPPTPKPRPEPLILADMPRVSQMLPIRSPGSRTPKLSAKFGGGGASSGGSTSPTSTPSPSATSLPGVAAAAAAATTTTTTTTTTTAFKSPFMSGAQPTLPFSTNSSTPGTSSFKPAVRVKPLLQVKPSEVRGKEPHPDKDLK